MDRVAQQRHDKFILETNQEKTSVEGVCLISEKFCFLIGCFLAYKKVSKVGGIIQTKHLNCVLVMIFLRDFNVEV